MRSASLVFLANAFVALLILVWCFSRRHQLPALNMPRMKALDFHNIVEHFRMAPEVTAVTPSYATLADIPAVKVTEVNCRSLIELDRPVNLEEAGLLTKVEWRLSDSHFTSLAQDCHLLITGRYITLPVSEEERTFPIAYSIVMYKDVHQAEQLLRAIYRPQNYYCIHVDAKAEAGVLEAMSAISGCFRNVLLASRRFRVEWGKMSVLQPELQCMEDLWNRTDWKYFINLTGQEFPLLTNTDIVKVLKAFNGSNAIDFNASNNKDFAYRTQFEFGARFRQRGKRKGPPPHNMKIIHGSLHMAATRGFVDFVLHHQVATDFREWVKNTYIPDETFFQSLQVNPQLGVPGSFTGDTETPFPRHDPHTRFKVWGRCKKGGKTLRGICILGVYYLPDMASSTMMFANKFLSDYQPVARMCLEELFYNRTREDLIGMRPLDLTPYKKMLFVQQHI